MILRLVSCRLHSSSVQIFLSLVAPRKPFCSHYFLLRLSFFPSVDSKSAPCAAYDVYIIDRVSQRLSVSKIGVSLSISIFLLIQKNNRQKKEHTKKKGKFIHRLWLQRFRCSKSVQLWFDSCESSLLANAMRSNWKLQWSCLWWREKWSWSKLSGENKNRSKLTPARVSAFLHWSWSALQTIHLSLFSVATLQCVCAFVRVCAKNKQELFKKKKENCTEIN